MKLFDYGWFKDFHGCIEELKSMAMKEDWDYKKNPIGKNPILENYIRHTFVKVYEEGKVLEHMDMSSSILAWSQTIKKKYTVYSRRTEDRVQFNGSLSGGEKPVTEN